jgi:hypothetical protein
MSFSVPPGTVETRYQSGTMLGSVRSTTVHNVVSPRAIPARLDISSAARLSLTLGAIQYARLDVGYGWQSDGALNPLGVDLRKDGASRFATTFASDDAQFFVNFNIVVYGASGWSSAGSNVTAGPVEFPFDSFAGPGSHDFADVRFVVFVFQTADDLAIEQFDTR